MKGTCKLYGVEADLRESHIYPKFVVDYLKKTGSNYLRRITEPNRRLQDAMKPRLLSSRAEQEFGRREKWFSEHIFLPYLEQNMKSLLYDENLYYFAISFLWRVLVVNLSHPAISKQPFYSLLQEAENEWRLFLRDLTFPTAHSKAHLFFTDRIKAHNVPVKGLDHYVTRALDSTIVFNEDGTFVAVYGKFLRFVFWGVLKGGDESKIKDLLIDPIGGKMTIPQRFEEMTMTTFFGTRVRELEALPKSTESQQQKILEEMKKNDGAFFKTDAGQSMLNDLHNLDSK